VHFREFATDYLFYW
jgi:1-pyrroline-5-carboxylate dehydrogenase